MAVALKPLSNLGSQVVHAHVQPVQVHNHRRLHQPRRAGGDAGKEARAGKVSLSSRRTQRDRTVSRDRRLGRNRDLQRGETGEMIRVRKLRCERELGRTPCESRRRARAMVDSQSVRTRAAASACETEEPLSRASRPGMVVMRSEWYRGLRVGWWMEDGTLVGRVRAGQDSRRWGSARSQSTSTLCPAHPPHLRQLLTSTGHKEVSRIDVYACM